MSVPTFSAELSDPNFPWSQDSRIQNLQILNDASKTDSSYSDHTCFFSEVCVVCLLSASCCMFFAVLILTRRTRIGGIRPPILSPFYMSLNRLHLMYIHSCILHGVSFFET